MAAHSAGKIAPLEAEYDRLLTLVAESEQQHQAIAAKIELSRGKIAEFAPKQTVREANEIKRRRDGLLESARRADEQAEQIASEVNPHGSTIERLAGKIDEMNLKLTAIKDDLERSDLLAKHVNYIYRSYSDRRKVKSFVIARHIPYFNQRLEHYLNRFDLDIRLKLTESLAVTSDKWGYDYFSGGERKRADVAFMLAMFDLHEALYGRQCNMIVLDEVDGRLDEAGIDALVGVIRDDLAHRVNTILIVSHRAQMRDYFHTQLIVTREARLSTIAVAS